MEIVKKGVPYKDRWMLVLCHRCLSTLKFQGKEVIEGVTVSYVPCPVCPADDNWVDASKAKPA